MRVFIGHGYNPRDRWIETFPKAHGDMPVERCLERISEAAAKLGDLAPC